MDKQALKAFAYLMAANFQALLLIGIAFELVSYLEGHYPNSFPWEYLVWSCCILIIAHSYYLMARYILRAEENRKKK